MGDSITESGYGNYPGHLKKLLLKNNFSAEVISLGRPGNTSGEYLKFMKNSNVLKQLNPDVVILMLGTNDVRIDSDHTSTSDFILNMKKIVLLVKNRNKNIKIYIATIPPIFVSNLITFDKSSSLRVKNEIVPSIKKLSVEEGLDIIDINKFFVNHRELLPGIHPSPGGYYKMAKLIYNRLIEDPIIKAEKRLP